MLSTTTRDRPSISGRDPCDGPATTPGGRGRRNPSNDPGVRRIVLDVTFADSSTLNLMRLLRPGRLVLADSMPARPGRLLDLTGAGRLFPSATPVEAARVV